MTRKTPPNKNKSQRKNRNRNPIAWRYGFLTLVCGLILIIGFFFAARQHFSSIDFSIKNSRLRKHIEELEAGKRRLILAKEIALSPAEIKKAAQKIGFREMTASNIEVYRPNANPSDKLSNSAEKSKSEKAIEEKPKQTILAKTEETKKTEKETKVEKKIERKLPAEKEKIEKPKMQTAKK